MEVIIRIWIVLFVVGILPFCACSGQEIQKRKTVIIIDPGHGGTDTGAIGVNGIKEKDISLTIAKGILKWNKSLLNNKYEIYLTRYSDTLISLSDRTKLVRVLSPDLFLSLHGNHSINSKAVGIEVYIYNGITLKNKNGRQSVGMANHIMDQLNEKLGYRTRGVKKANFQVLRQTAKTSPAILIELGFLSNKDEAGYLEKKENKNAVAMAILMSLKI